MIDPPYFTLPLPLPSFLPTTIVIRGDSFSKILIHFSIMSKEESVLKSSKTDTYNIKKKAIGVTYFKGHIDFLFSNRLETLFQILFRIVNWDNN
jgi:hypothetical protein